MIYENKKVKILTFIVMIVFMTSCLFINYSKIDAYTVSTKKTGIENFPESYKSYLNNLKAKHPNWTFVAVYTHLDFDYVIQNEMVTNRSLIPISYPASWKLNDDQVEYGWVNASRNAVSYSLDPRNFLTEEKIFQFEVNTYNSSEHTVEAVKNILKGTPMGDANYEKKYKKNGELVDMDKSYAEIIVEAGKNNNVSPVHLASRIIQENGGNILNNKCLYGSYPGYEGYYNFMNVGASPTGEGALINALNYAKNNGWTNPELAINGAAKKIYNQYIYYGQNTVYFEKFDVNFVESSLYLFGSQYMANIIAPSSESSLMYKAYNNTNKMDSSFVFHIPVYDNMPSSVEIVDGEYTDDNTLVYLDDTSDYGVTDVFNIRSTPYSNSSSNVIATIVETKEGQDNRTLMTRIKKGNNTGWDKVRLSDGREGYVASQYVKEYVYSKVESVSLDTTAKTLKVGESLKLNAKVLPDNAKDKSVKYSSSNNSVATVDNNGNVVAKAAGDATITVTSNDQGKTATCNIKVISKIDINDDEEIKFDESLNLTEDNYIYNLSENTTVETLKSKINVKGLTYKIVNDKSSELQNSDIVTTGSRVQVLRNGNTIGEYVVIILGDVNCDGKITSSDYVLIKNHIMDVSKLSAIAAKAADMNKDTSVNAPDYVLVKNYIMSK